ncbi:LPXTG cell wall anchor domain-containing protein [Erysipelothrix piscisicarius]|uniref:LPXTG cell wall anchor domain-containing protein n=1 Tax=Erysipelothrix piscisicarius TaxID=2485784 RepID=UPI001E460A8B|nr:LPXTG cell wall anchor domain-containing protein [Erysipelothrix piscisicarius]
MDRITVPIKNQVTVLRTERIQNQGFILPSTGIAVEYTVLLASGLVVLGFVLMLMNKRKTKISSVFKQELT